MNAAKILPEYGLLTERDAELIGSLLDETVQRFGPDPIIILEIGVEHGRTSRGIAKLMGERPFRYIGIDNNRNLGTQTPFQGAELIVGDSAEVFDQVPSGLHFVFIDGCHCVNHVILDVLHYGAKVLPGGIMVIHDADPAMQGTDFQGHGPRIPEFHIATTMALELLSFRDRPEWLPLGESRQREWGGANAYRRTEEMSQRLRWGNHAASSPHVWR